MERPDPGLPGDFGALVICCIEYAVTLIRTLFAGGAFFMKLLQLLHYIVRHPLNHADRSAAIARFMRWQIASRILGQPAVLPFINETRLLVRKGMTGATGNWYAGLHECADMAFVLHALRPGDLFVDIGANVGSYTVLAAGAAQADAIAVEPIPSTFSDLTDNILLNALTDRVELQCCGVSDSAGTLVFTAGLDTMNRLARPDDTGATAEVPVITLDELCATRTPQVLKIDVEGHELAVLDGGPVILADPALEAVVMETNGSGEAYGHSDDELLERMKTAGFTPCSYNWRQRKLQPVERGKQNTIFVRAPDKLSARCTAAPQFRLINGTI